MSKIIAIVNQKGGVGKTTSAFNISAGLAKAEKSVLAVDLDPQGNLSEYFGFTADGKPTISELIYQEVSGVSAAQPYDFIRHSIADKLDYIPASKVLSAVVSILGSDNNSQEVLKRIFAKPLFSKYDYIIIDCKPSLDLLVTNALAAADGLIIPVQAELFAYQAVGEIIQTAQKIRAASNPCLEVIGILLTMYRSQTSVSAEVRKALTDSYGKLLFDCPISFLTEAGKSACNHESLVNKKGSRLGLEYMSIVMNIIERK